VFGRAGIFEREPVEYALARLGWAEGRLDAARAVMTAAARSAPDEALVYFPVSAAVSGHHTDLRAIAEACGFRVFQEKEGFWWTDAGRSVPESRDLRWHPMSNVGRAPFIPLIGRRLTGTLDRGDRLTCPRYQPRGLSRGVPEARRQAR
jgi:hypothetical protein